MLWMYQEPSAYGGLRLVWRDLHTRNSMLRQELLNDDTKQRFFGAFSGPVLVCSDELRGVARCRFCSCLAR